jgi:hypothetical protein
MTRDGGEPPEAFLLAGLRWDWPQWGFLVIRGRWIAVHGRRVIMWAPSAADLRHGLETRRDEKPQE